MEMSGINNMNSQDNNYMYGFLGMGAVVMGILSMQVGGLSNRVNTKGWENLLEECGLFALVNGMPAYVIARDRESKSAGNTAAKNIGMYAALYLLLENGGFFNNLLT
jgi:hypothetical protein